jgi:RimJ/RimL family protein N-acetyltransferase
LNGDIRLRPIRPDDMTRLQEFHRRLSPEAIRLRFHGYMRELPDAMARRFCAVDGHDRVAFVAVAGDPERIVGVGRFDRERDHKGEAEMAFVVEDAYQGHGIGSRLLSQLIEAAHANGIHTLVARVLPGNSPMRHLLQRTGYPLRSRRDRDADCLIMETGASPSQAPTPPHTV